MPDEKPCRLSFSISSTYDDSPFGLPESPWTSTPGSLANEPLSKTVFLVRHGEALHNVAEKSALQQALADNNKTNDETLHREAMEIARKSALSDEGLKDAPLSAKGKEQAVATAATIMKMLLDDADLKPPEAIFVSPLQRALQTAAVMFPNHSRVHVRNLLRERCTGFPCDERSEGWDLAGRKTFSYMSFDEDVEDVDCDLDDAEVNAPFRRYKTWPLIEEKPMLRKRTAGLGKLLQDASAESVCLVTHKAFLRELERGPFNRPTASEFSNCEVRVYDVFISEGDIVRADLRRAV
mmetsp:Transcript_83752/g.200939  ORF Transcript_83752/g.200939 Transcript_83752/m.200939 type:complete len:295 (+) Transcript_83752:52-936(+)|eukprot:CAMPEP_0181457438 /NCGR_PEP_ID=MMETSP1110-20121109/31787_1 /TAXON_ID=174948 /ORGANISM="Symbiodinium sp., Strain CCMP421" /LENGTH=294 /DNA_ID=CAMNT_0023581881 /DNA_START=46 /DNA_END=930 /DNA_ORIENTATION=-